MCSAAYIRTYACAQLRTYVHTHVLSCIPTYIRMCSAAYIRMCSAAYIRTYACAQLRTYVHTHVLSCVRIMYVNQFIFPATSSLRYTHACVQPETTRTEDYVPMFMENVPECTQKSQNCNMFELQAWAYSNSIFPHYVCTYIYTNLTLGYTLHSYTL